MFIYRSYAWNGCKNTLRFGPINPVWLTTPKTGFRAYAAVQLRQDNKEKERYRILLAFKQKLNMESKSEHLKQYPA